MKLLAHEQRLLTMREYFITRLPMLAIVGLVYLGWWFFLAVFFQWGGWGLAGWLVGCFGLIVYGVRHWFIWKNDCCIITTQRIIDIQKRGAFDTTVREVNWTAVKDIQYQQRGFWATMWGYGAVTIIIQDAPAITLWHVYQPAKIRDILSEHVPTLH